MKKIILVISILSFLGFVPSTLAEDSTSKQVMKQFKESLVIIKNNILTKSKYDVYKSEAVEAAANEMAAAAAMLEAAVPWDDLDSHKGYKAEVVRNNRDDFLQKGQSLVDDALALASASGDAKMALAAFKKMSGNCKACHTVYRQK